MKRMIRSSEVVEASEYNRSDVREAISIAEALKYVMDDMSDDDFEQLSKKSPQFYDALNKLISGK